MSLLRRYRDKVSLLQHLEEGVAIEMFRRMHLYCDGWWKSVAPAMVGGKVSLLRWLVEMCCFCDGWWQSVALATVGGKGV